MPILFHCGVIGGGVVDWLNRHPRRNAESAKRIRELDETARKVAAGEQPPPGYRAAHASPRRLTCGRFTSTRSRAASRA